eukprot:jgi/Mesvir1/1503/Mv14486-RA.1
MARVMRSVKRPAKSKTSPKKKHRVRAGPGVVNREGLPETPAKIIERHGKRDIVEAFEQWLPNASRQTQLDYGSTNRGNDVFVKEGLERQAIDAYQNLDLQAPKREYDRHVADYNRHRDNFNDHQTINPNSFFNPHRAQRDRAEADASRQRRIMDAAAQNAMKRVDGAHMLVTSARKRKRAGEAGHQMTLEDIMMRVPKFREGLFETLPSADLARLGTTDARNNVAVNEFRDAKLLKRFEDDSRNKIDTHRAFWDAQDNFTDLYRSHYPEYDGEMLEGESDLDFVEPYQHNDWPPHLNDARNRMMEKERDAVNADHRMTRTENAQHSHAINYRKSKARSKSKRYAEDGTWLGPPPTVRNRPPQP